jgi:ubiquitin C-terminal hydrolase
MFGLPNIRGSCWVNAALQGAFACPSLKDHEPDATNPVDQCLTGLYRSKGENHLADFMGCIKTSYMPAGENIGDSHELLVHLLDKLPWLDKEFRFKTANQLTCKECGTKTLKEDSVIELSIAAARPHTPILESLKQMVAPIEIEGWQCDHCKEKRTCVSQMMFGTFPNMLMIHRYSHSASIDYASILVLNQRKYALCAVLCYNGAHWWAYTRKMPPGQPWYECDDARVREMGANQFPVAGSMRVLLYSLLEN